MTALLGWILQGIELVGRYALWAIETGWNGVMDGLSAAVAAAFALLPSMASAPGFGTPGWLGYVTFFYPVGAVLGAIAVALNAFIAFLAIRQFLRIARAV